MTGSGNGFKNLLVQPEEKLDLAAAALHIALEEYPDLDVPGYLMRLDRLAEKAARRLSYSVEADVIDSLDSAPITTSGLLARGQTRGVR
jgi:hypothetical protein